MIVSVKVFEVYVVSQWMWAIYLKCSTKFNFSSKKKPRCFWYWVFITWLLLKINSGRLGFLILREKITSWASLGGSGLKLTFHWYAELLLFSRSLFKVLADKLVSRITKNRDVPPAKSLGFDDNSFDESLM